MRAITATAIDRVLQDAVAAGTVPNVVAMAADRDGVIYEGAAGPRVAGGSEPVTPDSIFRLASMTKLLTTAAALQLIEDDKLEVDEPVETYRPEFAQLQVLEGFDGDTPRWRPPAKQATVRHLLTHTSGLSYWFWNADTMRWHLATGTPTVMSGEARVLHAPLVADPGSRFEYGISGDWLGLVVEAASGQGLDAYLAEHVLGPLGMDRTAFLIDGRRREELVPIHLRKDGAWAGTGIDLPQNPEWWSGGHGLYSTPRDYTRLLRMLLNHGTLDGAEILRPETVEAIFSNQIGALEFPPTLTTADPKSSAGLELGPGFKWGLGVLLNTRHEDGMRAAGSGGWAGLYNTYFWVDLSTGVAGTLFAQTLPFADPSVGQVSNDFERALYASL